jgi:hypothetical protein
MYYAPLCPSGWWCSPPVRLPPAVILTHTRPMTVTGFLKRRKRGEMQLVLWPPQRLLQPWEGRFSTTKLLLLRSNDIRQTTMMSTTSRWCVFVAVENLALNRLTLLLFRPRRGVATFAEHETDQGPHTLASFTQVSPSVRRQLYWLSPLASTGSGYVCP